MKFKQALKKNTILLFLGIKTVWIDFLNGEVGFVLNDKLYILICKYQLDN